MGKLRHGMLLPELEATMRAEGGTFEKMEDLGCPATARYYRFGDELLRVDGSSSFLWEGETYDEDHLVFIDWHVSDYYIYSPEAEVRRMHESIERLKKAQWLFPDSDTPSNPFSEEVE